MNLKNRIIAAVFALCVIFTAGTAQACVMGLDGSSLTNYMGDAHYTTYTGSLSGTYCVTPVFTETSNAIYLKNSSGGTILGNWTEWKTVSVTNLGSTWYSIASQPSVNMTGTTQVKIFSLTDSAWFQGNLLAAGTLIIGLEDTNNCSGGYDYNDLILIAKPNCAPTPVPAAVWLLGSGVMGVFGLRRARGNARA